LRNGLRTSGANFCGSAHLRLRLTMLADALPWQRVSGFQRDTGMPTLAEAFVSREIYRASIRFILLRMEQITPPAQHPEKCYYSLLSRLQSVMNAAGRLIFSSSKFPHITPLLLQLHWLKAPESPDNWGLHSNMQSSCTSVFMDLHPHTLPTSFVRWQMSTLVTAVTLSCFGDCSRSSLLTSNSSSRMCSGMGRNVQFCCERFGTNLHDAVTLAK